MARVIVIVLVATVAIGLYLVQVRLQVYLARKLKKKGRTVGLKAHCTNP